MPKPAITIAIQEAAINISAEYAALTATDDENSQGAASCFVGRVRGGGVQAMTLEHYPGMTEQVLTQIAENAAARWQLGSVRIVHRVGRLLPGEEIVFVGAQSRHRQAAFSACAYMTDFLKTDAPFWKKEETGEGSRWVEARATDDSARDRWQKA